MRGKAGQHLALISDTENTRISSECHAHSQLTLFPMTDPNYLIFASIGEERAESFLHLLSQARPSLVIDFRVVPRFDFYGLNRRNFFELFERLGSNYIDFPGLEGIDSHRDARFNPALLGDSLSTVVDRLVHNPTGPLLFIFEDSGMAKNMMESLPSFFHPKNEQFRNTLLFAY